MIRRGFWFTAGAVVGIAGYRRAVRAVRTLLPQAQLLAPIGRQLAAQAGRRTLGAGGDQHETGAPGHAGRHPASGRAAVSRTAAAGTAAFVRDVRTGMADYMESRRDI